MPRIAALDSTSHRILVDGAAVPWSEAGVLQALEASDVLVVVAHGDNAHLNLDPIAVCGAVGDGERDSDGRSVKGGCVPDTYCKRAAGFSLSPIFARNLRCRIAVLVTCNAIAQGSGMYPSDVRVVDALLSGGVQAVLAPAFAIETGPRALEAIQPILAGSRTWTEVGERLGAAGGGPFAFVGSADEDFPEIDLGLNSETGAPDCDFFAALPSLWGVLGRSQSHALIASHMIANDPNASEALITFRAQCERARVLATRARQEQANRGLLSQMASRSDYWASWRALEDAAGEALWEVLAAIGRPESAALFETRQGEPTEAEDCPYCESTMRHTIYRGELGGSETLTKCDNCGTTHLASDGTCVRVLCDPRIQRGQALRLTLSYENNRHVPFRGQCQVTDKASNQPVFSTHVRLEPGEKQHVSVPAEDIATAHPDLHSVRMWGAAGFSITSSYIRVATL